MSIGEQLDAALGRIDELETKLNLVLTYLDERGVDRINTLEYKLNRLAIASIQMKNMLSVLVQQTGKGQSDFTYFTPWFDWIGTVIDNSMPTNAQPGRTELEEQITAPEQPQSED